MKKTTSNYYVYEWYDTETNIPFYVGKGKNNRAYDIHRNKDFLDFYNTHKCDVRIVKDKLSQEEAFKLEYETTIKYFNTRIKLVNKRLGNYEGYSHTDEAKKKISDASKEHWRDITYRHKTIKSISHPKKDTSNMKKAQQDEYNKLKQRISHLGKEPYNKGMKMSEEYCKLMKEVLNKPITKKRMSLNNNSNKPIEVINKTTKEKYQFYNINDFIRNQTIINNPYKDKRNLWRYIRTHSYEYNDFVFKEVI